MKISKFHPFVLHIVVYHFLTCFTIFFTVKVNVVSGKTDLKTRLLLQNIRTHLTQKAEEIIQQKECESGFALCKSIPEKVEGDEEKSEELKPPPKIPSGHHKPTIKVNFKNIIQTNEPKVRKGPPKKHEKDVGRRKEENYFRQETANTRIEKSKKENERAERKSTKLNINKEVKIIAPEKPNKKAEVQEVKIKKTKIQKDKIIPEPKPEKRKDNKVERVETKKSINGESRSIEKKIRGKSHAKVVEYAEKAHADDLTLPIGMFVFSMASNEMNTELCRKHKNIYLKQLKKYKTWALMMFDASAKPPSGILQGNINQYGDFDECLSINAVFKKLDSDKPSGIKGKYCLADIDISTDLTNHSLHQAVERIKSFSFVKSTIYDPNHFIPRFTSINWGLCVPDTCSAQDVEKLINSQLRDFNYSSHILINAKVLEEHCVVKDDLKFKFKATFLIAVGFYAAIIGITMYATYLDVKAERDKRQIIESGKVDKELKEACKDINDTQETAPLEKTSHFLSKEIENLIMAFSLKKNLRTLFDESNEGTIGCVHGIKSIFSIMLYFGHKIIPLGWTSFSNRIFLTKISNDANTVLLRTSIIYTDSFLLMSGLLTTYNLSREIRAKGKISWRRKILARFVRLTPALLAVLLFYAYVWDQLGSGPLWNPLIKKNSLLCQKYMWRNLLYIQNFFAFENMCAPQTHQLALDMQLFILAPLFVYLLHNYDKVGFGILQAIFLLSSILRYTSTANNNLSVVIYHGMPVSQLYRTANYLYSQSLHRASPYIMGAIVGHYLQKFKGASDVPKAFAALGWIIAFSFGFYSVVSPTHMALRDYTYDVNEAAKYAAVSPVAWSIALAWFISACHLGFGGKLNEILCSKIFLVFSRISYSLYLTQFLVFFYSVGVKRIPETFTLIGTFNVAEFLTIMLFSIIVTLLFDIPMIEVKKIIMRRKTANSEICSEGSDTTINKKNAEEEKNSEDEKDEDTDNIKETDEKEIGESEEENDEDDIEGEGEYEDEEDERMDEEDENKGRRENERGNEGKDNEEDEEDERMDEEDESKGRWENERGNEVEGNEEDEENEEACIKESDEIAHATFKIQPLRRSVRMHFDEQDDWLKDQ